MKTLLCMGIVMPLLLLAQIQAQSSPLPTIDDYDNTSLPTAYQIGGDTTFCKARSLTIHGEDFKKATGGEVWDTTAIYLGNNRVWPLSITSQSNGNNDHIYMVLPDLYLNDTCLLLQIVKRTILFPDTFLYIAKDTICLTGDIAQVTYPSSLFCIGDTNPLPSITLSQGSTGMFCCPSGAASFAVFPSTGEIPLHQGAVGPANRFLYCTTHPRCGDTTTFTIAIEPRQASTATINGQSSYSACQGCPPVKPDSANLYPIGGMFRSWTGLVVLDSLRGLFAPTQSPTGQHSLWYIPSVQCFDSTEITVTLIPTTTATVGYPSIPSYLGVPTLCDNAPTAWPVFTNGNAGGTFIASPNGLAIGFPGNINPANSIAGTYSIQYATSGQCPDTVVAVPMLKIDTVTTAQFTLAQSQLCSTDTLFPTAQHLGGTWQVVGPTGQVLYSQGSCPITIASTGISPATNYQLRHITGGFCTDTAIASFTVLPQNDPTFNYPPNGSYCMGDPDPYPLVTGMGGGIFSAVTPSTVVDQDGRLHLQTSGAGLHTIHYWTGGACPDSMDVTVQVFGTASANFAYSASLFCSGDTNPLPQILGNLGGSFSGDTGLAVVASTGEILLSQSQAGTWNVTYTLVGSCQAQFTQTVQISPTDSATTFAYPQAAYCQANADPLPLIQGDTIGSFVAGAGIVFSNTDRGQLDLSEMQAGGPYIVYFDIENRCAIDQSYNVWINQPDNPSFAYPQSTYCEGGENPIPSSIALQGGSFTEPTMNIVFANDTTGEIDASMSNQGGPYFITYTTNGPCPESSTFQLVILAKPYTARLTVSPDSVYCTGQDIAIQATAGGAVEWRWYLNGNRIAETGDILLLSEELGGIDTVAVAMSNSQECSDSLGMVLRGLPAPSLTAKVRKAETNALGSANVEVVVETDNSGTMVDWSAVGANLKVIIPPAGTTIAFGPDSTATISLTATFQTPYDLGLLKLLLSPHNASCDGFKDTVSITLSPQTDMIFVPEVFTPDGNGQNDTWMITCLPTIDPMDYRIHLFNGSGGKVLEMEGLSQDFDGGTLPDGVYWWVLEDQSGNALQNGGLTIRRK